MLKNKKRMCAGVVVFMMFLLSILSVSALAKTVSLGTNFGEYTNNQDMGVGGKSAQGQVTFRFGNTFQADYLTTSVSGNGLSSTVARAEWKAKSGVRKTDQSTGGTSAYILLKGKVGYSTAEVYHVGTARAAGKENITIWQGSR